MRKRESVEHSSGAGTSCRVALNPERTHNQGVAWVVGAFLICPCHLPITLALAGALLGGTAAGAALQGHLFAAGTIITLAWLAATWYGLRLVRLSSTRPPMGTEERQS